MKTTSARTFTRLALAASACTLATALSFGTAGAASNGNGASIDANCEVVSVGNFYCTIDGKGYYCITGTSPDKNKDCIAAAKKGKTGLPTIQSVPGVTKLKKAN